MELVDELNSPLSTLKHLLWLLIFTSLFLVACREPAAQNEHEREALPVPTATSSGTIFVETRPDQECLSLLTPRLFEGLKPRMTAEEASAVLGPPARQHIDDEGQKFFEWTRPGGRIVMSYEKSVSFGTAWTWKVRGYPAGDALIENVLPSHVASQVSRSSGFVEVLILNPNGTSCLQVIVKRGRVDRILLANPPTDGPPS